MAPYRFHEGAVPAGYRQGYEPSLFNLDAHRSLQAREGWCSFLIVDDAGGVVCGAIHVHVQGSLAQSPLRSPFGSIEFSADVPAATLTAFVEFMQERLKEKGITHIIIKHYPEPYAPHQGLIIKTCLLSLKYAVVRTETSSVIDVTSSPPETLFHYSELKRLRKCRNAGMQFQPLAPGHLGQVYHFIRACRNEKQYPLSMTLDDLERHVTCFPNDFLLFGVFNGEALIAAAVTIRVKNHILYDFYHDHASAFDHFSPVVMLVAGIYEFCHQRHIRLLDLGTSEIDGGPNLPLLRFKRNLGGKPAPKLTFEKILYP